MIERRSPRMFKKLNGYIPSLLVILGFVITWIIWISKIPILCTEIEKQGDKIEFVQTKTTILEERLLNMEKTLTKIEINIDKIANKYAR